MIYLIRERAPNDPYSESYDEFVDFEDLSEGEIAALLATQSDNYFKKEILATMSNVQWRNENRTHHWTSYISIEHFFPWPEAKTGKPTPPADLEHPIKKHFDSLDRGLLERLVDAHDSSIKRPAKLGGMSEAFRAAILEFKWGEDG